MDTQTLFALFDVDFAAGRLVWRERPEIKAQHKTWNKRWAGREAGSVNARGYREIQIGSARVLAHRAIYAMAHGAAPDEIDHIDGDPSNNAVANLRPASREQNQQNRAARCGTSRFKGVCWYPPYEKWRARIQASGREFSVGYFDCEEEAAHAYDAAALKYHGEFARLNFEVSTST